MLILGLTVSEALLSTLIYLCETCGNSAAHHLIKRTRKFTLFFIPLFAVGATFIDTCTACGRVIDVPRERRKRRPVRPGRSCGKALRPDA